MSGSSGGDGSDRWGGDRQYVPSGLSPEELERQRKRQKATELNETGIQYWNQGDYESAARHFQQALDHYPDSKVIRDNLEKAQKIVFEQRRKRLEQKRQLDQAKVKINQVLEELESAVTGTPSPVSGSGGIGSGAGGVQPGTSLKFIRPKEPIISEGTKTSTTVGLQFMGTKGAQPVVDPSVVKGGTGQALPSSSVKSPSLYPLKEVPSPGSRIWPGETRNASERLSNPLDQETTDPFAPSAADSEALLPAVANPTGLMAPNEAENLSDSPAKEDAIIFEPAATDSEALLPAVANPGKQIWPGETRDVSERLSNPLQEEK